jgi:putative transposase
VDLPLLVPDVGDRDAAELQAELLRLEKRIRVLQRIVRLLFVVLRTCDLRLEGERLPSGEAKTRLLSAIESTRTTVKLATILRWLGLSSSRYHAWIGRKHSCALDDRATCPRSSPGRLTAAEVNSIHDLATSTEHRHMSIRALALHAQRIGRVFVSAGTWLRLIRSHGWRRPRLRIHPASPKEGVRASKPNEYWHVDVTIIRLIDGTRVYLHAAIDNFSRRILAWKLAQRLEPQNTSAILVEAAKNLGTSTGTTVVADSGVENVNSVVDDLLGLGQLRRVLAQVEVNFSNSMIEAFWRALKHNWLFLNQLDSFAAVERLVAFYIDQHNSVIPHAVFHGKTPDEVYFGKGDDIIVQLAQRRADARLARLETNRRTSCSDCYVSATPVESRMIFDGTQLRPQNSVMS